MRATALTLLLVIAGCAFAQKHPAVTAGIVGGVVGFGACEVDSASTGTCAAIGGGTAVFLGGIVALVTLFADTEDHSIPPDYSDEPPLDIQRVHTHTAPPPGPPPGDAGVPAAPPSDAGSAAPAPSQTGPAPAAGPPPGGNAAPDAGVPAPDAAL